MSSAVVRGLDRLERRIHSIVAGSREAAERGVYAAAQDIMLDARRRAPGEDGYLEASGYVALPEDSRVGVACEMGFGGASEAYVVRQHEDSSLHHPALDGDSSKAGEAFFFRNAVTARGQIAKGIVADYIRRALKGRTPSMPAKRVPCTPTEQMGSRKP